MGRGEPGGDLFSISNHLIFLFIAWLPGTTCGGFLLKALPKSQPLHAQYISLTQHSSARILVLAQVHGPWRPLVLIHRFFPMHVTSENFCAVVQLTDAFPRALSHKCFVFWISEFPSLPCFLSNQTFCPDFHQTFSTSDANKNICYVSQILKSHRFVVVDQFLLVLDCPGPICILPGLATQLAWL